MAVQAPLGVALALVAALVAAVALCIIKYQLIIIIKRIIMLV